MERNAVGKGRRASGEAMGLSTQDTFYVDPRVDGCDRLSSRAKRLGLKTKGFLGEGVTVCVAASSSGGGGGGKAGDGATAAAAATGQSRGRRLSRIQRMVSQAQTEPASVSQPGAPQHYNDRQHRRQGQTSIGDQARQLQAAVVSGQAFRLWLERQEDERGTGRDGLVAGAKGEAGGRPKATGRALTHRGVGGGGGGGAGGGQRAGSSRFRSQEHPRVVIKDLDGLEADRVQAFPPELLRKCYLHTDTPPGICPFTPREQWEREVLKTKKKDAQFGAPKVAARTPPAGALKPRRGGWCECCQRSYIGTMSEHCKGEEHRVAVTADPDYEALVACQSWTSTGGDAEGSASNAGAEVPPQTAMDVPTIQAAVEIVEVAAGAGGGGGALASAPRSPVQAAAATAAAAGGITCDGDDDVAVPAGEAKVLVTGLDAAAKERATEGHQQGSKEVPTVQAAGSEGVQHVRDGERRSAALSAGSPLPSRQSRGCVPSPTRCRTSPRRLLAQGKWEGPASDNTSTSPEAFAPSAVVQGNTNMRDCPRGVRLSPRRCLKVGGHGETTVLSGVAGAAAKKVGGGGGGGGGNASPEGSTMTAQVERRTHRRPSGSATSSSGGFAVEGQAGRAGGSCGGGADDDAKICSEASHALLGGTQANSMAAAAAAYEVDGSSAHQRANKDTSGKGDIAGTPPQASATRTSRMRSSPSSPSPKVARGVSPLEDTLSTRRNSSRGLADTPATAACTPATSVASIPSSRTYRHRCQVLSSSSSSSSSSSVEKSLGMAEPPASVGAPITLPSSCSTSPSSMSGIGQRRGDSNGNSGHDEAADSRTATANPTVRAAASPPSEAARRNLRARHGTCAGAETPGAFSPPCSGRKRRAGGEVAGREDQRTPAAPRVATGGRKTEHPSASSPADEEARVAERSEKRRKRALAMLADSPAFHGVGVSPVGSAKDTARGEAGARSSDRRSAARLRACDDRGQKSASVCDGRRSSLDRGGGGSVRSPQASSTATPRNANLSGDGSSSISPGRKEDRREGKKRKRVYERGGELGGLVSADSVSPLESDRYDACSASSPSGLRGEGGRSTRARFGPGSRPEDNELDPSRDATAKGKSCSSGSGSSTRERSKRRRTQTTSTASRMGLETAGLETAGDSSPGDIGGAAGSGAATGADQQISPQSPSSESSGRPQSVPCSLASRFDRDRGSGVGGSRRRDVAVGTSPRQRSPGEVSRERFAYPTPGSRRASPPPRRRNSVSTPGSFLSGFRL